MGTAWLAEGLTGRDDVELVSVELDDDLVDAVERDEWPARTRFVRGDALSLMAGLGRFHLIFADAPAGKWTGLHATLEALEPGGVLVVDDMDPSDWADADHEANTVRVRRELLADPRLMGIEIPWASGIIVAVRQPLGRHTEILATVADAEDEK